LIRGNSSPPWYTLDLFIIIYSIFLAELLQSSWSPYTELLPVLENIFTNERPNVAFLKRILRAAKPHFLNVFKNPVCSY
jgi:hypothetical protein